VKIPNPGEKVVEHDDERCSTVLKEAEGESGGFVCEGGSRDAAVITTLFVETASFP
jgi:hypothetical protein